MDIADAVNLAGNCGYEVFEYGSNTAGDLCNDCFSGSSLSIGETLVRPAPGVTMHCCKHKGDKKGYLSFQAGNCAYDICHDCLREMDREELKDHLTFFHLQS